MLKFMILVTIILWIDSFFVCSETQKTSVQNASVNVLSIIIVVLIMIGFLS